MAALDVLGDPVRRRILELLATGEHSAGDIVAVLDDLVHPLDVERERGGRAEGDDHGEDDGGDAGEEQQLQEEEEEAE